MMYLLDTNIVSEFRKLKSGRLDKKVIQWANSISGSHFFISVITVLELETGVLLMERKNPKQGAVLRTWLDDHVMTAFEDRILFVDTPIVLRCAKLHIPDPCSERDAMIAATAFVHGMTLVTRNVSDFQAMGVDLFNPWDE